MNGGQSEQLKSIKKAMKIHEIINSDKSDLVACKKDLMTKIAMDESGAEAVAHAIREMFLPKLMKADGIERSDMPKDFDVKMTELDDDFADETPNEEHEDEGCGCSSFGHELESPTDDSEVDADEIATIHITVPKDKIREVENALDAVLGDNDAESTDQADSHKDNETLQGDYDMDKKELEARKALRKTILAAVADDDEIQSVSRVDHFDHDKSEQYREEDYYDTKKGGITDPDFATLDYAKNRVMNMTGEVENAKPDLGLQDTLTVEKFDGAPDDPEDYKLDFNPFEVPSQGNKELYVHKEGPEIPSEGKIPQKRTINAGAEPTELDEEILAAALRSAGVETNDLAKLTYAEAKELFKAIRTASEEREHYSKDGKLPANFNDPKDPDGDRKAVTEDGLRDHSESEEDPEKDHVRKELYSSSKKAQNEMAEGQSEDKYSAYANMIKKLMRKDDIREEREAVTTEIPTKFQVDTPDTMPTKVDPSKINTSSSANAVKEAELYRARVKTAYAMSGKLAVAGMLPAEEMDAYAEGMLSDNLTVTAMIKQTKILLNTAAANAEKLASHQGSSIRTAAVTGISFNPSVRGASSDLSGARDIQDALKNIGWTTAKVATGMEE